MKNQVLIPSTWSSLPDEFRERIGSTAGRQRCMVAGNHLLIVAHQVPEPEEPQRRGVLFWLDASGDWRASNGDPGKAALEMHLDRFAKRIDQYEVDEQKALQSHEYLPILDGIVPIMRSIKNLLATLEEARDRFPKERLLIEVRDRAYDLSRQADLLHEDVKNSMEVAMIRRATEQSTAAQQMATAAHRLNTLAAIFFPMATLGTVMGTTLTEDWNWSRSPIYFLSFLVIGAILGLVVAKFINRPVSR